VDDHRVGDVPAASNGTRRCSVSRLPFLPMITLGKSSIQMELFCSASTSGAHEHPSLMSPDHGTPGNGLLLFFRVDDSTWRFKRARSLVTRLEEEPHVNPNTQTKEFSLRDPDGYLRFDQCALCGLTRRCSCRGWPGSWGSRARPRSLAGRLLPSDRPFQ